MFGPFQPVAPSASDVEIAKVSNRRLALFTGDRLSLAPQNGHEPTELIEIPSGAVPIIRHVLECMAQGHAISLAPIHAQLTTHQAANLLGVSRPYLIKLLDQNAIPHTKVNRHRRIVLQDLLAYKQRMHAERQKTLDELTAEGQRLEAEM